MKRNNPSLFHGRPIISSVVFIVVVSFLGIHIWMYLEFSDRDDKAYEENIIKTTYHGRVLSLEQDPRTNKHLICLQLEDRYCLGFYEFQGIENINVGDSILKIKGEETLKILKSDTTYLVTWKR
jgi:hypothetical protein